MTKLRTIDDFYKEIRNLSIYEFESFLKAVGRVVDDLEHLRNMEE